MNVGSGLSEKGSICSLVVRGFMPLAVVEYYGECSSSYGEVLVGEDQDVISSCV